MFHGPKLFSLLSSPLGPDWEYDHFAFSLRPRDERAEFNKSFNLVGSWSGRNFLIRTATAGAIVDMIYFRERIRGNRQSFALFTRA